MQNERMDTKFWLHCFRLSFILVKRLFNIGDCISLMVFVSLTLFFFLLGVFLPTGKEFATNCPGVICNLKRDVTSKLHASRSSDGPGKASDIFDHQKGTTSGTEERKDSWWSIDLGSSHRLVITHYSLRHGKRDGESVLTHWQLEGSNDGMNWKKLETNYKRADPPRFRDPHPYYTGTWSVEGKMGAFRFFRIFQTGRNSSHKYGIYLSGIELFGVLLNIQKLAEEAFETLAQLSNSNILDYLPKILKAVRSDLEGHTSLPCRNIV